jgi:hypothetical protein
VRRAEVAFGQVRVVRPAHQLDVRDGGSPSTGVRLDVMELEPGAGRTAFAGWAHETTAPFVAPENGPTNVHRDMARRLAHALRSFRTRLRRHPEAPRLESADELGDGTIKNRLDVAVWDRRTQQIPQAIELRAEAGARGELDAVAIR